MIARRRLAPKGSFRSNERGHHVSFSSVEFPKDSRPRCPICETTISEIGRDVGVLVNGEWVHPFCAVARNEHLARS
jgi:hypothetical protein